MALVTIILLQSLVIIHTVRFQYRAASTMLATTARAPMKMPAVLIYRRSPKTGSTSMTMALSAALKPLGYRILLRRDENDLRSLVRGQTIRPIPQKLLVVSHNPLTRAAVPSGDVLIADTIRDGYAHMTSYCRFKRGVEKCDDKSIIDCLRSNATRKMNWFRWAGRPREDDDTYIDLPLSSMHPALSTSVLRSVFPDISLQVEQYRDSSSACPEMDAIRRAYNSEYAELDAQVDVLRKRMLLLTGYPTESMEDAGSRPSWTDMLDAAEQMERRKYRLTDPKSFTKGPRQFEQETRFEFGYWMWGESKPSGPSIDRSLEIRQV